MQLETLLSAIAPADQAAKEAALQRWASIAKPLGSLGLLEEAVVRICAMGRTPAYRIDKRALVVMCADNGVIAQKVTQTGNEITALVAKNLTTHQSCTCYMAKRANVDIFPVDIGMAHDVQAKGLICKKIAYGTRDFSQSPAMTRQEALQAIWVGIDLVRKLKEQGYQLVATGEMGIGNTTTSSAVAAVLLRLPVQQVTGRGAGLSTQGLGHKIQVIEHALALHNPDPDDPIDILCKVGGFDIAGMLGLCLGGALCHMPVVIDGFISCVAALLAVRLCQNAKEYLIASHVSAEPAGKRLLDALRLSPLICANMRMGEGTGAVAALPLLDMAFDIYEQMSTFGQIHMQEYKPLD